MRFYLVVLTMISLSVHQMAKADEGKILPGILNLPLVEGTQISQICKDNFLNVESTCVMLSGIEVLNSDEIIEFTNKYLEQLNLLGWQDFNLGNGKYYLEKEIPYTNCSKRVALGSQRSNAIGVTHRGAIITKGTLPTITFTPMTYACGDGRSLK